jgi:putrescine transport system permease protein
MKGRGFPALIAVLVLGFAFLYIPILIVIIFSFNESRLVTVWAGFSTKWYGELLRDRDFLSAAWLSLKIAALTATAAVGLGTIAAQVMTRFHRFRGRTLFMGMITAPLVMPEVITGLSLLLLFVAMEDAVGWPQGRGALTIWIAHVTFCTAYVAVVVRSRLAEMDMSIEEAAMDLGAPPTKVFFVITLPIIAPALLSGWLLAFTLSLDDLVIASFVAGPGSTTLPIFVFSSVRLGVSPTINALATIIVAVAALATVLAGWIMMRAERRRRLEAQAAYAETLNVEAAPPPPRPARRPQPAQGA